MDEDAVSRFGGRSMEARVAVLEEQIAAVEQEALRTRSRLHDLESDRATLRILMDQQKRISEQIRLITAGVDDIAERAAQKAVATALLVHDRDVQAARETAGRQRWGLWLQAAGVWCAFAGVVALILTSSH